MDGTAAIAKTGPLLAQGPKLFVLDARNRVERKYLLDWLHTSLAEGGPGQKINWISLPISDERADLRLDGLIEKLQDDPNTMVVPVRIVWRIPNFEKSRAIKKRHILFGDPRTPGSLRARSILMRDKRRAHCLTGQPATIAALKQRFGNQVVADSSDSAEEFASFVLRQASLVLDISERGLRGRRYKVPRYVADGLRTNPKFRSAMTQLSTDLGKSETSLYEEASKYMKELIARPSPLFIDMKAKLDRFMLSQGYEDDVVFDKGELTRLRKTMREHPTLLLFTHKTYIDGVTPTDLAYQNDLPLIHVFGGINLDFFGLGFVLRRAGTIFIRRSFENNPVYKLVLRHYVSYLLEKRFPMTWAFEGTRSRLGKLMPPRYGLLKYVMDSANANDIENVHIIPVVTSFDLIRDVEEYASEQTGRVKKAESLSWFVGYLRSLREPMGKVYVDFGEPVVIRKAPEPNDRIGLSKIAFEVAVEANRATPLTLTSLMCLSLLGTAPRAMTAQELRAIINFFVDWAKERNIRFSADLTVDSIEDIQKLVDTLVNSGLLVRYDKGSTTVYAIEPEKHPMASYYRNSIIHHFLDKAIIELSLLKAREEKDQIASEVFWEETDRLRDLFKFEFFYPPKDEYRENLKAELDRSDPDWKKKLNEGGVMLTSLTNRFQPLIGHAVFLPFVESYTVVLDILARLEPGQAIDKKTCVENALKEGRQAYLLRRITSEASIGKILFENGFKMAASQHLTGESTEETIAARKALLRKFRALSRRMEKSRLEVLQLADKIFD
ncbi:glycerol-3-phosphate 1-O-acyltransferase [Parasphingorhabdus halotolerans]|uniref:Glycerol-3-phosphate acyltransferase n=1 Tax=Parasphingorhabdus halotolerans TaxID=2725558 RepID=A0A6H2DIN2_9SPHN|nr:glycerol-3-phosphate 1-O-acyltransferase [Parasphingorhabdus halotolerans]QJB68048.1 glycerol-3-phosphate 1-O-acyltransferase [Parasphingorhabdus halotolerans]